MFFIFSNVFAEKTMENCDKGIHDMAFKHKWTRTSNYHIYEYWEECTICHIREKYNGIYKEELPLITPHVCRHTFCSNMAKSGMNPKTLQYIMGHSDIGVTLNTYTHFSLEDAKEEIEKICVND